MATAVRPLHLAVICLVLLHLLAHATTGDRRLVHSRTNTTTRTLPPHASLLRLLPRDAPPTAASSHHFRAPPSPSTLPEASLPHRLDVPAIEREDTTTASAAAAPRAPPCCPCVCGGGGVRTRAATIEDTVPAPTRATAPAKRKTLGPLLDALPLLAVPFLPPPFAALVALSSLATPVHARRPSDDNCPGFAHATCTVYRYLPGDGTVDRAQPFADLRSVCLHPRCNAGSGKRARSLAHGQSRGRRDDPFHGYCHVRTLECFDAPERRIGWRVLPVHQPVADPDAVATAGEDVCYVELEHLNYREGYYILCPIRKCPRFPFVCCTEFPHDAVAAAVWERRRMTYRDAVGWYNNDTVVPQLDA